jgi:hypothetical protein
MFMKRCSRMLSYEELREVTYQLISRTLLSEFISIKPEVLTMEVLVLYQGPSRGLCGRPNDAEVCFFR